MLSGLGAHLLQCVSCGNRNAAANLQAKLRLQPAKSCSMLQHLLRALMP